MSSPAVQPLEPGLADSVSAPGDLAISCLGDLAGLELTRFQAWSGVSSGHCRPDRPAASIPIAGSGGGPAVPVAPQRLLLARKPSPASCAAPF